MSKKKVKVKTNKSASKRFKVTGSGRIKYRNANRNHILTKKSSSRRMQRLRGLKTLDSTSKAQVVQMLPNNSKI